MDYITLTDLDIERACVTERGGARKDAVSLLGEDMRIKGWKKRLRGLRVERTLYEQAAGITALPKLKGVAHGESTGQMALM